jgi:hypothetical protein
MQLTPSIFFGSGYSHESNTHKIKFNTANHETSPTFTELTSEEAHPSTGDIRKLVYAIVLHIKDKYTELGSSAPQKMVVASGISGGSAYDDKGGIIRKYTITFYRSNPNHLDVSPE